MTDLRSKRKDGVRTLADLRSRCVISDETGCWIWRGATSRRRNAKGNPSGQPAGRVWLPDTGKAETAARASWLLSGRNLGPGEVVWHHLCTEPLCINPDHCRAGTKPKMYAAMIADGRLRGNPRRAAVNARNCSVQLLPVETVRRAEAMFAAGAMQKTVRSELGICPGVAARIRKGLHPHCSSAQRVISGASVFALGGEVMREPYSLVVSARRIKSPEKVRELLGRARFRADTYARLLSEWPALVAEFEREAKQVEARLLELTGAA